MAARSMAAAALLEGSRSDGVGRARNGMYGRIGRRVIVRVRSHDREDERRVAVRLDDRDVVTRTLDLAGLVRNRRSGRQRRGNTVAVGLTEHDGYHRTAMLRRDDRARPFARSVLDQIKQS